MARETENQALLFSARDPNALMKEVRDRYGERVASVLERVDIKSTSTEEQAKVVKELHEANPTADSQALLNSYRAHRGQIDIKNDVGDKWYNKVGRGLKTVALAPFKAVGYAFKKAPVLTTLSLTALAAFLAYHYGIPLAQFSGAGGDARTGGVARTLGRLGRFAPGGDTPGVGELPAAAGGSYGSFVPPPAVAEIPSM